MARATTTSRSFSTPPRPACRRLAALAAALLAAAVLHPAPAGAKWVLDGARVCTVTGAQDAPAIAPDGAGGAVMVWQDQRAGNRDIYAQRVDSSGRTLWADNGVPLCTATGDQSLPVVAPDGTGGAIVAWNDYRGGATTDIYAQRVDASGVVQWTTDGVPVSAAADFQVLVRIVSDGVGGAIMCWQDYRDGASYDIYAQRIDATGKVLWTADGVGLCVITGDQVYPQIISDGAQGAIVVWEDYYAGNADVYIQRVSSTGVPQWVADGVPLCTDAADQSRPRLTTDGAAGAIVTWYDERFGNIDVYAQRITGVGALPWIVNGVAVCDDVSDQQNPRIASDGSGGAIVVWGDDRAGPGATDVYAQRLDASGGPQWTYNGVPLSTAPQGQTNREIVPDGSGGAIVAWSDFRNGSTDIYAQRVDGSGVAQWATDGIPLCTAANSQTATLLAPNGEGGAIVTWQDTRSFDYNIYAQRVEGTYGYWGHPEPIVDQVSDIPNDEGGLVALNWTASGRDVPQPRTISHYTVWRAVDSLPAGPAAAAARIVSSPADVRGDATRPVYLRAPQSPSGPSTSSYYWELVGTQSANGWAAYTYSAPTRADSVSADPSDEAFMVAAHLQYDEYVAFPSQELIGHSVDNLAPAAPLMLTAQRVGADVQLQWNAVAAGDLREYTVYRGTSSGVTPVAGNFLASDVDTVLVDAGAPAGALYYIVTANDVHENQGPPSNEASVGGATGVDGLMAALSVQPNRPNPFRGTTSFEIGLRVAGPIRLEVYDVAGRRVRSMSTPGLAGWQRVSFDGRDGRGAPLASGVYLYRVSANGKTVARKMTVAR